METMNPVSAVGLSTIYDRQIDGSLPVGLDDSVSRRMEPVLPAHEAVQRQSQFVYIFQALKNTEPPEDDAQYPETVPTSIDMAGPGNYGKTEIDDGNEVVLLNDDVLTSVPNATVVIIDGNDLERISVLYQFPQFLEHCPDDCINVMVPRICSEAVEWTSDAQMAAAEALFFVVNMKAPAHIAKQIAWASLSIASKTSSPEVFDACGEIVSMILPQVHRYDVLQFIVPDAVDRAISEQAHDRRLAARIIGSLNDALAAQELEGIFDKTCIKLSEDSDDTVRAMMAQSLASVATKLPLRAAEKVLWPRLKQLMADENAQVRAAAMRAIAKSAEAHRDNAENSLAYATLLKPLFLEECKRSAQVAASDLRTVSDDTYLTLEIFSEVYGYFLCSVSRLLKDDDTWTTVLNTLRQMVTCNGPTVRHWCAFNMPAVSSVCSSAKAEHLTGVIPALAGDTDIETRATLAAGIHEITKALCNTPLRGDVIRSIGMLFTDDNAQVRMNALGHFSNLLILLSPGAEANLQKAKTKLMKTQVAASTASTQSTESTSEDENKRLAPMFSSLELMSFDSWRTQKLLAEELQKAAYLVPQDMLCEHVAPLLFQMARESTFLVRKASMRALIYTLRYIPDVRRRNHILKHFKTEWARGKVYWTRLAYIEAAECAHGMFSAKMFTLLFKEELLNMQKDTVANVRLRLLRFMGILVPIWKNSPEFQRMLQAFTEDGDTQVAAEAKILLESISNIPDLSEEQRKRDKSLEVAEDAFYVHRPAKKKRNKGKQPAVQGRDHPPQRDTGPPGDATANYQTYVPSGEKSSARQKQADAPGKRVSKASLTNKIPASSIDPSNSVVTQDASVTPLTAPTEGNGVQSSRLSANIEKPNVQASGTEALGNGNENTKESAPQQKAGLFRRLFAACFRGT